jgi:Mrp family chromosome partitioning ATPase
MRQDMELLPLERTNAVMPEMEGMGGAQPDANPLLVLHNMLRGRYVWAIAAAVTAAAAGVWGGYKAGSTTYQSTAIVRVMPVLPKVLYDTEEKGMPPMYQDFMETQAALIQSPRAVDSAMSSPEWQATGKGSSPETVQDFTKNLSIVRKGELIYINYQDKDPRTPQPAVSSLLGSYQKVFAEQDTIAGQGKLTILQDLQTTLTGRLSYVKRQILDISNRNGTGDLQSAFKRQSERVNELESLLYDLELRLKFSAGRPGPTSAPSMAEMSVEKLADRDQKLARLLQVQEETGRSLTEQKRLGRLENHPMMLSLKAAYDEATKDVEKRVAVLRGGNVESLPGTGIGLTNLSTLTVPELEERRTKLTEQQNDDRAKLKVLFDEVQKIEQAKIEQESLDQQLAQIKQRQEQLDVEGKMHGRISVVSEGQAPYVFKDTHATYAVAGGMGGAVLGFGVVALIGLMDRRLRSPSDLLTVRQAPVLGVLPYLPDDLSDPEQVAMTSHFVHQIRTLLQIWRGGDGKQVLSVTSPVAGTGKTSLTLALGVSFASADSRTLLIDCDVIGGGLTARANAIVRRKIGRVLRRDGRLTEKQLEEALRLASGSRRRLGEILLELGYLSEPELSAALVQQQKANVGLLEALAGERLEDCIAETGVPGLSILPLGGATAQHVSKVSPQAMRKLLAQCRERYDTILIDTGPTPGSLEAAVVAAAVDGVILTVSRGEQRPLADKCVQHLVSLGARVAGIVFNRASTSDMAVYSTTIRSNATSVPADGALALSVVDNGGRAERFGPMARAVASSGLKTTEEQE